MSEEKLGVLLFLKRRRSTPRTRAGRLQRLHQGCGDGRFHPVIPVVGGIESETHAVAAAR